MAWDSSLTSPLVSQIKAGLLYDSFAPTDIAEMLFWFDATKPDSMLLNGSLQCGRWNDLSANRNHVTQGTDANKPILTYNIINNLPALKFYNSSTASSLSIANNSGFTLSRYSAFAVVRRHADAGAGETIFGKWNATGNQRSWRMRLTSGDLGGFSHTTTGTAGTEVNANTAALSLNTNYILDAFYDGTNINTSLNNGTIVQSAVGNPFNGTAAFTIGDLADATANGRMFIGELIMYKNNIGPINRTRILNYLTNKWGIALTNKVPL